MGKYMRKSQEQQQQGDFTLMEISQSLGVRTRAKSLALRKLQKSPEATPSPAAAASYLQLRNRRLEKPSIVVGSRDSKRRKDNPSSKESCFPNPNPNSNSVSRALVASVNSGSVGSVSRCLSKDDGNWAQHATEDASEIGIQDKACVDKATEASFGENFLDSDGKERSTRESTPCSLIRDPNTIRTPGSSTKPPKSAEANAEVRNSIRRHIPTAQEMNEFFVAAEEQHQRQFIEKYNFDPVKDEPLPGRFEWVKLDH